MNLQEQLAIQRLYDEAIKDAKSDTAAKPADAPRRGRPPKLQPPAERPVQAAFAAQAPDQAQG